MNKKATFGAGCFWCIEAIFHRLNGVTNVLPGYAGGHKLNPTYSQVCTGSTGHAEVCQIEYNSELVSFEELLNVFWMIHDPTTLNRQGNDIGTQYRSVVFYHDEEQKKIAEFSKNEKSSSFSDPIVTEISALTNFFPAEKEHKLYFDQNSTETYCRFVILPKVEKFKTDFKSKLKKADD